MSEFTEHSVEHGIAGGWLGTYHYRGLSAGLPPVRFEAAFTAGGAGRFSGTILDDGAGGEATAAGAQAGREVAFTKAYVAPRPGFSHPVEYAGTLSEDGRTVRGTWRRLSARGVWEARRRWSEGAAGEARVEELREELVGAA